MTVRFKRFSTALRLAFALSLFVPGLGYAAGSSSAAPLAAQTAAAAASTPVEATYRLGPGDKLHVTVYGEDDLTGDYSVDGGGNVNMPLITQVMAGGLTAQEFGAQIAKKLGEGYLKDPKVSVQIITYRPFTILGEVKNPGQYPCTSGMNVLNAVALAGGFTYRANDSKIFIRHKGGTEEIEMPADQTTPVLPEDVVSVHERFF